MQREVIKIKYTEGEIELNREKRRKQTETGSELE